MFFPKTLISTIAALGLITSVDAQFAGLSNNCSSAAASFLLGDLGTCLSISSLIPIISVSGSIITPLQSYFQQTCPLTPCTPGLLNPSLATINTQCAPDLTAQVPIALVLKGLVGSYGTLRAVGCLQSKSNSSLCLTDTLTNIQSASNQTITIDFLESVLIGSTAALSGLAALPVSVVCTDCVKGMFAEYTIANPSSNSTTSTAATLLNSKCGSGFATSTLPTAVTNVASATAASSTAASSTAATTSKASSAGKVVAGGWLGGLAVVMGVLVV